MFWTWVLKKIFEKSETQEESIKCTGIPVAWFSPCLHLDISRCSLVLLIALAHGLFVALVAAMGSRFWTALAALVSAAFGVLTGNPAYIVVDLAAVSLALYAFWPPQSPEKAAAKAAAAAENAAYWEAEERKARTKESGVNVWIVGALLVWGYLYLATRPTQPRAQLPDKIVAPTAPSLKAASPIANPAPRRQSTDRPSAASRGDRSSRSSRKSPLEKCLEMMDDEKMVACLEALK